MKWNIWDEKDVWLHRAIVSFTAMDIFFTYFVIVPLLIDYLTADQMD